MYNTLLYAKDDAACNNSWYIDLLLSPFINVINLLSIEYSPTTFLLLFLIYFSFSSISNFLKLYKNTFKETWGNWYFIVFINFFIAFLYFILNSVISLFSVFSTYGDEQILIFYLLVSLQNLYLLIPFPNIINPKSTKVKALAKVTIVCNSGSIIFLLLSNFTLSPFSRNVIITWNKKKTKLFVF